MPLTILPDFVGRLAVVWPSYHLGQVALAVVGRDTGSGLFGHLAVLAAITLGCFLLARRRLINVDQMGPG
jgi:ABC-2 type transport system permease protein